MLLKRQQNYIYFSGDKYNFSDEFSVNHFTRNYDYKPADIITITDISSYDSLRRLSVKLKNYGYFKVRSKFNVVYAKFLED
jgi:hypothetical protein